MAFLKGASKPGAAAAAPKPAQGARPAAPRMNPRPANARAQAAPQQRIVDPVEEHARLAEAVFGGGQFEGAEVALDRGVFQTDGTYVVRVDAIKLFRSQNPAKPPTIFIAVEKTVLWVTDERPESNSPGEQVTYFYRPMIKASMSSFKKWLCKVLDCAPTEINDEKAKEVTHPDNPLGGVTFVEERIRTAPIGGRDGRPRNPFTFCDAISPVSVEAIKEWAEHEPKLAARLFPGDLLDQIAALEAEAAALAEQGVEDGAEEGEFAEAMGVDEDTPF